MKISVVHVIKLVLYVRMELSVFHAHLALSSYIKNVLLNALMDNLVINKPMYVDNVMELVVFVQEQQLMRVNNVLQLIYLKELHVSQDVLMDYIYLITNV